MPNQKNRRDFLRTLTASTVAASAAPAVWAGSKAHTIAPPPSQRRSPNERIGLATIGMGIIGFIDTRTALRVPGTEFVAAADVYDGRLERTKEVFGPNVATTRDYREVLARDDVDAVIIATPDHWHAQMAVDALEAGKHVYLEKPMVHDVAEGPAIIEAVKRTGHVLQVGSQFASSALYGKLKELIADGAIGELNMIEAVYNRHSSIGAWQYSIAPDASPETIDWDRFLGDAPRRPFDPVRFFRWRNYWDYGTAMSGDLFVHLLTGIHYALDAHGPTTVSGMGGLRYWTDGRDVPDVMLALMDYPETERHPAFTLSLQCNFVDGSGGQQRFRFVGSEGVIDADWRGLTLTRNPMLPPSENAVLRGYNSVQTFAEAVQEDFAEQFRETYEAPPPALTESSEFRLPEGYDERLDHFKNFFNAMHGGPPVVEDAVFGYRAAAPTLLANQSYRQGGRALAWDPEAMKVMGA